MKFKANLWKRKLKMKLEYYCKGDYRFTNQVITRSEMVIKKYGMLRKSFFKVYKSGWYQSMLLIKETELVSDGGSENSRGTNGDFSCKTVARVSCTG